MNRFDPILMLDMDGTLHRPLSIEVKHISEWGELRTACGLVLDNVTVGPLSSISEKAARRCPDCFRRDNGDH